MWPQLLLVSDDARDRRFAQQVALTGSFALREAESVESARRAIALHPGSVVLWDAESATKHANLAAQFGELLAPQRVFALTDRAPTAYPHLADARNWSNHILRRIPNRSIPLFVRLMQLALATEPRPVESLLPKGASIERLRLKRSSHKRAAIEAMQSHLQKKGIGGRMAAMLAQAVDELILNAVFDAPRDDSLQPTRHALDRSEDFELSEREQVEVELAAPGGYLAVSVTDRFGSLRRSNLFRALTGATEGPRLGLSRVHESGISLVFTGKARESTRAMLICPEVANYKEFRTSFHFLSVQLT